MSISHYSAETRVQLSEEQQQEEEEAATWLHTPRLNLNKNCGSGSREEEKEAMFEKPLTPSDVGKLNRLVIPKQHAEKHFPLDSSSDTAKGLLLSFEDESGKCWRFRYSYWNSSQSYVLTKGWSRYVKDKLLHAGDVVLFHRHRTHPQRFFISCTRPQTTTSSFYSAQPHLPFPYHPHSLHAPGGGSQGQNSSSGRVLRLFGVNMECQPDHDSQNSTSQSSYTLSSALLYNHQPSYSSTNPQPHPHMLPQLP